MVATYNFGSVYRKSNSFNNCLNSDDQRDKSFKEQGTQKIQILN